MKLQIKALIVSVLCLTLFGADAADKKLAPFTEKIPGTTVTFDMIPIPAGSIKLKGAASETAINPFYIGKTELTWDAYDPWAFQMDLTDKEKADGVDAKSRPSKPYGAPDRGYGHDGYPALGIPYPAAVKYCEWLSKKTGHKYRLPTEAEWEYCCRAGADKVEHLDKAALDKVAWFTDNSKEKSHPVAKKDASAWGLYDMLGNVSEWVVKADGKTVVAGGAWNDNPEDVACDARREYAEDWQSSDPQSPKSVWWLSDADFVGLRLVCDPG